MQMIQIPIKKLSPERKEIVLEVQMTNHVAQSFFRKAGFNTIAGMKNYHHEIPIDTWLMQRLYQPKRSLAQPKRPKYPWPTNENSYYTLN
jgi:hypothetical protein